MKLKKKEKHFWKCKFNISSLEAIPTEIDEYKAIDSDEDDQFMYFLTLRIHKIHKINLKCTYLTDEGVKHISRVKNLKILTIRNHENITKNCIPYLNAISDLEILNITKTQITLDDVKHLDKLINLKELYISSDETLENNSKKISEFNKVLPNCNIYLNTNFNND